MPLAATTSSGGSSLLPLLFILLLFGALWFFMIRPQQRRSREVQAMQSSLGIGDEVMTGSGIYGIVTEIDEEEGTIGLEISPGVAIRVARGAVARVVSSAPRDEDVDQVGDEIDHPTDAEETANKIIERKKD